MKHKTHHLYYLFYPRGWIIITLLLFSATALAQEQTPPEEFYIGATFDRGTRYGQYYYDKLREAGMNILSQYADGTTNDLLDGLNFLAINSEFNYEWIYFYSTAYYSKWEAEEDQIYRYKVGFKHRERIEGQDTLGNRIGKQAEYLGRQCWSTEGLSAPACSLMYGPHYHQEKTYKRWPNKTIYPNYDKYDLKYTPRYIMALKVDDPNQLDITDAICKLSVIARYRTFENGEYGEDQDTLLKSVILYASDFQPYNAFHTFYIDDGDDWYEYPPEFRDPENGIGKRDFLHSLGVHFFDRWGDEGVQFRVDWLGDNSKCNLYIDYVEVYDNDGGQDFADNPDSVTSKVTSYAQGFPQSEWSNMKYWVGCDEPSSLDDYIPLKTVDAILESIGAPRLITTFYPWWEGEVNEDNQLVRYYNTVQPAKLMIDFFPCLPFRIPAGFEDWETTRKMLQICSSLQLGFWYQAQAAGVFYEGEWTGVRRPDSVEFKAQNMLALAHGVKGLIYWHFRSCCGIIRGILDSLESSNGETSLYRELRDHFVPRLKGKLGKTLMDLNYTGNFLQLRYSIPTQPQPVSYDYLTLGLGQPADIMNWHCGFFIDSTALDDDYFHLTNLITTFHKNIYVTVRPPDNTTLINYRFRNVEGLFDTTFRAPNSLTKQINYPPGEGYLYQFCACNKIWWEIVISRINATGNNT